MGTISEKLDYLEETKDHFFSAMDLLGYSVDNDSFRSAVDKLYVDALAPTLDDLDTSSIVSYYEDEVKEALAHTMILGDDYVHHIVLADQHYTMNFLHSFAIVSLLQNTGLFSKIILLGDNANNNDSANYTPLINEYSQFAGDVAIVYGNHDYEDDIVQVYRNVVSQDDDFVFDAETGLTYYYDDSDFKIRYIFLPTGGKNDWATARVEEMPEGWTAVLCCHYALYSPLKTEPSEYYSGTSHSTRATDYAEFYNFAKTQKLFKDPSRICVWLHGHTHRDALDNKFGVWDLSINTDSYKQNLIVSNPHRIEGTTSEQSITILSINPKTHIVETKKIGFSDAPYYDAMRFNYNDISFVDDWEPNVSFNSDGVWNSTNGSIGRIKPFLFNPTEKPYYVYKNDFTSIYMVACAYLNGVFKGRNNETWLSRSSFGHNIMKLDSNLASNANQLLISLSVSSSSISKEDIGTYLAQYTITDTPPIFTDWTPQNATWFEDYVANNARERISQTDGACCTFIRCEEGQTITFKVNSNDYSSRALYIFFADDVAGTNSRRIMPSGATNTISAVVPSGANYFCISGAGLKPYYQSATLTIT